MALIAAWLLLAATLPGTVELALLTCAAYLPKKKLRTLRNPPAQFCVVIPAHNEEKLIERTIGSLKKNGTGFDIVVVADHCSDRTVALSLNAGAQAITVPEGQEKGKHNALRYAFNILLAKPYDFFAVVDADSLVDESFVSCMKRGYAEGHEAMQVRYAVANPAASLRTRLINIAFMAFNFLRPLGRSRLGLSAGIFGNGFGISREVLLKVPFQTASVVEDLSYHVKLVEKDISVAFIENTSVKGEIPSGGQGLKNQRIRWEGGRLLEMARSIPPLTKQVLAGNTALIEPLLDLLTLPLAFHCILLLALFALPVAWGKSLAAGSSAVVIFHILSAIYLGKGGMKDLLALFFAPFYVAWKLCLLVKIINFTRKKQEWIKSDRSDSR